MRSTESSPHLPARLPETRRELRGKIAESADGQTHARGSAALRDRAACSGRPRCRARNRLGFVQADPIRSPARAQDLILRQRVKGYRAGDLGGATRRSTSKDVFINYGFVTPRLQALMHPRRVVGQFSGGRTRQSKGWRSSRIAASSIRVTSTRISRRAASPTTGRIVERDDAPPRPAALSRCAARRPARGRDPGLRVARARDPPATRAERARRGSARWSTSSSTSTRRCRA